MVRDGVVDVVRFCNIGSVCCMVKVMCFCRVVLIMVLLLNFWVLVYMFSGSVSVWKKVNSGCNW